MAIPWVQYSYNNWLIARQSFQNAKNTRSENGTNSKHLENNVFTYCYATAFCFAIATYRLAYICL